MTLRPIHILILLLCCVPLFFLNIQSTHSYGDDWAQYLQEAVNIAQGKPYYRSGYVFNPLNTTYAPPQYPPGYPLLIAPLVRCTGTAILPLLYLNSFFLCMMLFAGYYYFRGKTGSTKALCLAIILTYLFPVIDLKGQVLSDIPCAVLSLLYLAIREQEKEWRYGRLLLLSAIAAAAMLIRVQAVVLILAELLFFVLAYRKRNRPVATRKFLSLPPQVFLALMALFLFALVNYIMLPAPQSGIRFYLNLYRVSFDNNVWKMILSNSKYLLQLFNGILYRSMDNRVLQVAVSAMTLSSMVLAFIGFIKAAKEKLSFSLVFFVLMCFLILVTPIHQGLRYFLPAVPVYLLLLVKGAGIVLPSRFKPRTNTIAILGVIIFLALGYNDYRYKLHGVYEHTLARTDSVAFDYIRNNIPDKEIVLFAKPRLLVLYTGKRSMNLSWQHTLAANRRQFDSLGIGYLLYCRHLNFDLVDSLLWSGPKPYSDSTVINKDYTLYYLKRKPMFP